jgi:hypothetical protein
MRVANVFFLALAVVIGAAIYYAIVRSDPPEGPTSTQPLDGARTPKFPNVSRLRDFINPITPSKIPSINEIDQIAQIVGVPIHVIEQRARPTVYRDDEVIYKGETIKGFIPDGASLPELIRQNWVQAKEANTTHADIAGHLQHLIDAAKEKPGTVICYDPITGSTSEEENIPRFQVRISKKEDPDTDIFRPMGAGSDIGASYEEAVIINTALQGKYIRWTPVRQRYISEFGFYSTGMDFATVLNVLLKKIS